MTHVAILGRRLDRPVVNLGFSGNGRLEPEVGRFLVEIDASVFILDCLPNLDGETTAARTAPMVRQIRATHPEVPVVMVEDRSYADAAFAPSRSRRNRENRESFRRAYEELVESGIVNLHYVRGDSLLGEDGEATVDGSHPTDLGFMRQADALEPVIRAALGEESYE
jgi:lysophospholipase L1-like esterase